MGLKLTDDNPWDDLAFKARVKAAAKKKGVTLGKALDAAGVSRYHLDKSGEGRSTSTILRLAKILDVAPAYLFGLTEYMTADIVFKDTNGKIHYGEIKTNKIPDSDKLVQISLYTRIIADLATLVYTTSDCAEDKGKSLREFVLHIIDQVANNVERDGKNT